MCRFLWPFSNQCKIAVAGEKSLIEGPFNLISIKLFMVPLPSNVRVELLTMFIWLNPLSTTAVLMDIVSIIWIRDIKCLQLSGGIRSISRNRGGPSSWSRIPMTVGRVVVYPQKNGQAVSLDETKCRPGWSKIALRPQ